MANEEKNLRELAGRIYDLDEEVYRGFLFGTCFQWKERGLHRRDCKDDA